MSLVSQSNRSRRREEADLSQISGGSLPSPPQAGGYALPSSAVHAEFARSLIDPKTLMSIRNLELRARLVVEGFWAGLHRSPYHGFSVEFTEYRPYTPGDDPRYLDWRVLARSDRYYLKRFEDETNLRCHLILDQSRSMTYGSLDYTKAEYAATLAATLAFFLHLQGDAVGLLTFDEGVRDYLPARHRLTHLRQLMVALEKPASARATDLIAPLQRVVEIVRKRGLIVLVSDFLAPVELLETALMRLAACGHEIAVFHILDPAEAAFEFNEPTLFEDAESGRLLMVDPVTARAEYQRKLDEHCAMIRHTLRRLDASYTKLSTDQPLELALFEFLGSRSRRRAVKRTGNSKR
jgi:uncharacterized protein (DUF58 family)